jgi:hypothetical protein
MLESPTRTKDMVLRSSFRHARTNSKANGAGYYSFTYALVLELKALSYRSSFSVGDLYGNVYGRTQNRMQDDALGTECHPAPVHLVLTSDNTYQRSIQLSLRKRPEQEDESSTQNTRVATTSNRRHHLKVYRS